ncbi:Outer membrane protein assembly factor BamB [Durusdinium trenchii]|uniref:Outer membrane protein assembly factor BamB n=1 Tax=Durusdinium trenchii TaxID=1381693 RepID=A0ABP0SRF0_9DINO
MRCGRWNRVWLFLFAAPGWVASWLRKEAEIAANGHAQLIDVEKARAVEVRETPLDDQSVWKLLNAASDPKANITGMVQKLKGKTKETAKVETEKVEAPIVDPSGDPTLSTLSSAQTALLGRSILAPTRIREKAYHPTKGGNANHSGYSPYLGVADVSFPSWTFLHPEVPPKGARTASARVFHGSPVIDADSNVYIQSTSGWIFSLNREGKLRWSFDLNSEDPQNPGNMALLDGTAFVCTEDGVAWAIDLVAGLERWRRKIATHCSTDPFSITAGGGGLILIPCNPANGDELDNVEGSSAICAVSEKDGSPIWTYAFSKYGSKGYNLAPSIVDGKVYFSDLAGASYAISLQDGKEIWRHPGPKHASFSTGSAAVGHDGHLYNVFNMGNGGVSLGEVRCHDLRYGGVLWSRSFDEGVNAAPAIGPGPKNQSMVVVAVGNNPECLPEPIIATPKHAQILALDGQDGSTLWSFTAPEYSLSCAGNTPTEICCPSMWSQPTIASDGRVYVNWSGGKLFSLMDVDLDGKIDLNDPREFSFYHHGKGSNSQTALAPGLMVAAVCNQVFAYQEE